MTKSFIKQVLAVCSLLQIYGCERPNPYKFSGDTSAVYRECPTPQTNGGNQSVADSSTSSSKGDTAASTVNTVNNGSSSTGYGIETKTELDQRELDYSEALRTASLLILGDAPTLSDVYSLGDLALDQQKTQYEILIDIKCINCKLLR